MRAGRLSPAICHPGIRREDTGHGGGQFNWHKGNSLSERGKVQLDFSPWRDDVPLPGLFLFLSVTSLRMGQNTLRSGRPPGRASSPIHRLQACDVCTHPCTCVRATQSRSALLSLGGLHLPPQGPDPKSLARTSGDPGPRWRWPRVSDLQAGSAVSPRLGCVSPSRDKHTPVISC